MIGADCPVEPPDPLPAIAAAVHRPGWDDGQGLTVEEALALYTGWPADHFAAPPPLGPGAPADMVVVAGEVGSPEARVETVYREGVPASFRPIDWPG